MKKEDKNCRYLNLYPEDFDSNTWEQVCDSVDVRYDVKEIAVFYDKTMTKTGDEDKNEDILSGRDEAMDRYNKKLLDKLKTLNTKGR